MDADEREWEAAVPPAQVENLRHHNSERPGQKTRSCPTERRTAWAGGKLLPYGKRREGAGKGMVRVIELTRLNGLPIVVNAELVKFIEATPDTLISLTSGEKIMVKEPVDVVSQRVMEYRHQIAGISEPS